MTDSRILGYDPNYGEVRMVTDCDDMTMERKIIPHRALVSPTPRPLNALVYEILSLLQSLSHAQRLKVSFYKQES